MEESLERGWYALERRGVEVSRSKTKYMSERETGVLVKMQGAEVANMDGGWTE